MIVTIGAMDNIASPGAQLDYYQSVLDKMGRKTLDQFARLFVVPQAGHGMPGRSYKVNGKGEPVEARTVPFPNGDDNMNMLMNWVENKQAPDKTLVIDPKGKIGGKLEEVGYLLCSYPNYPKYMSGPADQAASYVSAGK